MIDEIYNYRQGNLLTVPMSEEWETLCIKFEEELTEEQLTMFHKLCDLPMKQEQLTRQDLRTGQLL